MNDLITLDFETRWSNEYTLRKMTTEEYVRDARFYSHMLGCKVNNEPAFTTLLVLDTLQTHNISHVPTYQEENPLLGHHPSNAAVNRYMIGCAIGHYLISRALPAEDRPYWQWLTLGVEGSIVAHNFYIGVHAPF